MEVGEEVEMKEVKFCRGSVRVFRNGYGGWHVNGCVENGFGSMRIFEKEKEWGGWCGWEFLNSIESMAMERAVEEDDWYGEGVAGM